MPLTRSQIITDVRARLHEPIDGRYFDDDPEMYGWLNLAVDEIARKVGYEKYTETINGSAYAFMADDVKYYQLPNNATSAPAFFMMDPDFGIRINGLRILGTTNKQMDMYQEKGVANAVENSTIHVDDYFTESYSGIILNYTTEFILKNEVDAGRTGRLMWFVPTPADTDVITYRYLCLPVLPTAASSTTNLMRQFEELLIYGLMKRCQEKMYNDGLIARSVLDYMNDKFDKMIAEAYQYMKISTAPDKTYKIRTAKQVYGMYNTQNARIYGFNMEE